jgi:hypothetical protein
VCVGVAKERSDVYVDECNVSNDQPPNYSLDYLVSGLAVMKAGCGAAAGRR